MKAPEWKQRILFLSRDREMREKICTVFGSESALIFAETPVEALKHLEGEPFQVLIMDERGLEPEDDSEPAEDKVSFFELSQYASHVNQRLTIILLLNKILGRDGEFARKCGATMIADRKGILLNQIPYIIRVLRKRTFRTLFLDDFIEGALFPVDLYHYMPMSNRYVVFLPSGLPFTPEKHAKLLASQENFLYVREECLEKAIQSLRQARGFVTSGTRLLSEEMALLRERFRGLLIRFFDISTDGQSRNGEQMWDDAFDIVLTLQLLTQRFDSPQKCIETLPFPRASAMAHGINSALYSLIFGRACGLAEVERLAACALLANIGLSSVNQKLITRNELTLTVPELAEYATHPEMTLAMMRVKRMMISDTVRDAILYHHEKNDGTGFPAGLAGDKIPVSAAFLAIVGAFDHFRATHVGERSRTTAGAWAAFRKFSTPTGVEAGKFSPQLLARIDTLFNHDPD